MKGPILIQLAFESISIHFSADGSVEYFGMYSGSAGMVQAPITQQMADLFLQEVDRQRRNEEKEPSPPPGTAINPTYTHSGSVPDPVQQEEYLDDVEALAAVPGEVIEDAAGVRIFRPDYTSREFVPLAPQPSVAPAPPPAPPKVAMEDLQEGVAVPLKNVDTSSVPSGGARPRLHVDMDAVGNPVRPSEVQGPGLDAIRAAGDFDTDGLASL